MIADDRLVAGGGGVLTDAIIKHSTESEEIRACATSGAASARGMPLLIHTIAHHILYTATAELVSDK